MLLIRLLQLKLVLCLQIMICLLLVVLVFFMIGFMFYGVRNWFFLMLIGLLVEYILWMKLVWWIRNVGVCSMFIIEVILFIGVYLWMLVSIGMLICFFILVRIFRFFFMFGSWNVVFEVWLVLLKLDLKMKLMLSLLVIFFSLLVVLSCSCIDLIMQGLVIRNRGWFSLILNLYSFMVFFCCLQYWMGWCVGG